MLTHLQLREFAIVDQAELEFAAGLCALTGETGAGKSIIVDALTLIAGGRAGADIVRHGAERAEVSATVTVPRGAAESWLQSQSIEHEGEVVVRRVVGSDGRSRAYLNGQVVPLQLLREFGEFVFEIHGQQEFQRLVNRGVQRELLDSYGVAAALRDPVDAAFRQLQALQSRFAALEAAAANRDARMDLLRYQAAELAAELAEGEDLATLLAEQKKMANRGRLATAVQQSIGALYESDAESACDLLGRSHAALRGLADIDPSLAQAQQLIDEAAIAAREAASALRRYLDTLDVDPSRIEALERRTAALESLARKHRVAVTALPAQRQAIEEELAGLEQSDVELAQLGGHLDAAQAVYAEKAGALSQARSKAAKALGDEITASLATLGMSGGRFEVRVERSTAEPAAHGTDVIEFLVSANPGQPVRELAKVASGGELSRISLAIQVAAATKSMPNCMVFDEVDAGIGGGVAEIVGRKLRELGETAQVLCVTHLPQVAAQAHTQFRVAKISDGKTTKTTVTRLAAGERVEEIARMLGGVEVGERARAHAREMLQQATVSRGEARKRARS